MNTLTEYLLEFGSMGLFAAFLVWQHLNMQKRFDSLVDRFQEQLEKLRGDQKSEIDDIRDRYDKVLGSYNDERTEVRINIADKISQAQNAVESLKDNLGSLPFETLQIQMESLSLNQRNAHLVLEKITSFMKGIEEEKKLQAMARKLKVDKEG